MPAIVNLAAEFGAGITGNNSLVTGGDPAFRFSSQSANGLVLTVSRATLGSASAAVMGLDIGSTASGPVLQLVGQSFVSAVSIVFAASANWAGMGGIRVQLSDGVNYGWIPIIPPASFTAAAR